MKYIDDKDKGIANVAFAIYSFICHLGTLLCIGWLTYGMYIDTAWVVLISSGLGLLGVRKLYYWGRLNQRAADNDMDLVDYLNKLHREKESN